MGDILKIYTKYPIREFKGATLFHEADYILDILENCLFQITEKLTGKQAVIPLSSVLEIGYRPIEALKTIKAEAIEQAKEESPKKRGSRSSTK